MTSTVTRTSRQVPRRGSRVPSPRVQTELAFRTWGGKRAGAGRKPRLGRSGVAHRTRPVHERYEPVHVTMRAGRRLGSLRRQGVFVEMIRSLRSASSSAFRIVHFSVQSDHVHLLIEAHDKARLSRGMAGLAIRLARAVNRKLRRTGRVWADRYHARALRSPREVRHALVYILMNWRKHVAGARGLDPCSSARWLRGWKAGVNPQRLLGGNGGRSIGPPDPPVRPPSTWLAARGWRRHGLLGADERPMPSNKGNVAGEARGAGLR